jgi:hypothetical protein
MPHVGATESAIGRWHAAHPRGTTRRFRGSWSARRYAHARQNGWYALNNAVREVAMANGAPESRIPAKLPDPDPQYPIVLPNGTQYDQATMRKALQSRLPQILEAIDEGLRGDPIYEWQTNDDGTKVKQLVGRKPNAKIVELALAQGYGKPSENRANPSTRSLKALFARREDGISALFEEVEYEIADEDYE